MRKLICAFSLMLVLCLPVAAGEVQNPPKAPPPCTENCATTTTVTLTLTDRALLTLIQGVLGLIRG